jgi:hypothetical protein
MFLTTNMAFLNYCFNCGGELVEDADFCHGCGQELSKLSDNTTKLSENKAEEDNMYEDIDLMKDDINLDELSLHSSKDEDGEELLEMWREAIASALEEQDVTVEDIDNEDMFNYLMVDEIIKRSTKIILEKEDQGFN